MESPKSPSGSGVPAAASLRSRCRRCDATWSSAPRTHRHNGGNRASTTVGTKPDSWWFQTPMSAPNAPSEPPAYERPYEDQADAHTAGTHNEGATDVVVDFYWRPGCPFCTMLKRSVTKRGIPVEYHNIWEDPDAAAVVRSATGGNETVPTVGIAGHMLVNPPIKVVEELVRKLNSGELAPAR